MTECGRDPLVSVIVPAYNAAEYIADGLESVFRQTYPNFEVVLINDGSEDTEALERALQPYRAGIRYLEQSNRGPSAARNTGIRAARGSLVALLDSDDMWTPDFLAMQVDCFRRNLRLDFVWCDSVYFGDSEHSGVTHFKINPPKRPVSLESLISFENIITTTTVVARKEALLDGGLFDESMWRSEDYELWLRLARLGAKFDFNDTVLAKHRIRSTSLSADYRAMGRGTAEAYDKLAAALETDHELQPLIRSSRAGVLAETEQQLAKQLMDQGKRDEAIYCIEQANQFVRTPLRSVFLGIARISPFVAVTAARLLRKRSPPAAPN